MNILSASTCRATNIGTFNILLRYFNLKGYSTTATTTTLLNFSKDQQQQLQQQELPQITAEMSAKKSTDIVWIDLEMNGLDIEKHKILEISCLITDKELNIIAEGPCLAINHPKAIFENMNEWCMKHHYKSGLVEKCLESQITNEKAEELILNFLKQNIPERECPLAGNSVYMDRLFLCQQMPTVHEYMHYRIIDVSTIKELISRWKPSILNLAPKKKFVHRSLDDIKESIEELKYYRQHFFNN